MTFSILFEKDRGAETLEAPAFFADLNLDQIIDAVTAGKQDYDLKPFFYAPLRKVDTIQYRHEIMQDMEAETLREAIKAFAGHMVIVRRYLGLVEKLDFNREGWLLEAARIYSEAVTGLARDLSRAEPRSRGLRAFRDYVARYVSANSFTTLLAETRQLKTDLSAVSYCILIKDSTVRVRKYKQEIDYSAEVEQTFEKFKQDTVKDYRARSYEGAGMNHIEAQILKGVAKLYPELFERLDRYCAQHGNFLDETIRVFDREIQFYVAYLDYIKRIKRTGLKFCYPQIAATDKHIYNYEGFDLALADKFLSPNATVVCNDFYLQDQERILVITGPNQGGKTTFARAFGQLHYLASLGCPVPGRGARLYLFDQIHTHFEKEEDIANLRGKLQDDLVRIHAILSQTTPHGLIIMNEIFSSTTLQDAIFLSRQIMARITQLDLLCVFVTFIDEMASFSEKAVSMVSAVVPENPALRTFKIIRKPADGLAYAMSIADRRRVTYAQIKERIQP